LESLQGEIASTVFFESKHRIVDTLKDMYSVFGDREICVARELTKAFETIVRGSLEDVASQVASNSDWQKGEFVLVLAGQRNWHRVRRRKSSQTTPAFLRNCFISGFWIGTRKTW